MRESMRARWRHGALLGLCLTLTLGGCDCKERLRQALNRQRAGDTTGRHPTLDPDGQPISSQPREVEPNDRAEAATALTLTAELRAVEGALSSAGDVDWFAITAPEPMLARVVVEPKDPTTNITLMVRASASTPETLTRDAQPVGKPEALPVVRFERGALLIGVRAVSGPGGAYALRLTSVLPGAPVEAEPNNALSTPHAMTRPGVVEARLDGAGDVDVFALQDSGTTARAYHVEVDAADGIDRRVELLLGPDAQPFARKEVRAGQTAHFPNVGLGGARPTLLVRTTPLDPKAQPIADDAPADKPSTYTVRWTPSPGGPTGTTLEIEPNDAEALAMELFLPAHVVGYLHAPDDADTFALTLVTPEGDDPATPPTPAPKPAVKPAETTPGQEAVDRAEARAAALKALEAPAADMGAPTAGADMGEPTLKPLPRALVLPPLPVKTAPPHRVRVTVQPRRPDLRLSAEWRDARGQLDRAQAPGPGAPLQLCDRRMDAGRSLLTVRAVPGEGVTPDKPEGKPTPDAQAVLIDYALRVEARDGLAEIEPNDTPAQLDALPPGQWVEGALQRPTDRDLFAVDLLPPDGKPEAQLQLTVQEHPLDLKIRVLDADGGLVAQIDRRDPRGGWRLNVPLPAGRYLVEITAPERASCAPYRLRATVL